MATPLMGLTLPTVSVTLGPTWASQLNAALTLVDSHDHTTGKGTQVPSAGININADLTFNTSYKATNVKAVGLASLGATLGDTGVVTNVGGNLYWNNGSGVAVQITSGTGLNFASLGTIGGDYGAGGVNASVTYSDSIKTFTFNQDSNKPAKMAFGDIILGETITSPNTITIKSPTSLGASYITTLPTANPASTKLVQVNSSGEQSFADVDGTSLLYTGSVLSVKDSGITKAKMAVGNSRQYVFGIATMTIASPCVVTAASHGYSDGTEIVFSTTGALPTGVTAYTAYYVKNAAANTFELAATVGGASINTSGSQSGDHTLYRVIQPGDFKDGSVSGVSFTTTSFVRSTSGAAHFAIRTLGNPVVVTPTGSCSILLSASSSTGNGTLSGDLAYYRNNSVACAHNFAHAHPASGTSYQGNLTYPTPTFSFNVAAGVHVFEFYGRINSGLATGILPTFGYIAKELN